MRKRLVMAVAVAALVGGLLPWAVAGAGPSPAWTRQFGSPADDFVNDVAVDSRGRFAVAGETSGVFSGQANAGNGDAFVRVLKRDGRHAWTRIFGSNAEDFILAVAVDARDRIIVVGSTEGTLPNQTSQLSGDAFVRVYQPDGRVAWTRQFGSDGYDAALGVTVDQRGRIVVVGSVRGSIGAQPYQGEGDAFVSVFRSGGRHVWTKVFGSGALDEARGVAVDDELRVYVVGSTRGALFGRKNKGDADAFLQVFQWNGQFAWNRQFGTSAFDEARDVAIDGAGRLAVVGTTLGALPGRTNQGGADVFVRAYGPRGLAAWTRQFGTGANDEGNSVAIDRLGRVIVTGETKGLLPGQRPGPGGADVFLRAYKRDGRGAWTRQFGSRKVGDQAPDDWAWGVAVDRSNRVAVAGTTDGVLTIRPEKGGYDAFIRVYRQ